MIKRIKNPFFYGLVLLVFSLGLGACGTTPATPATPGSVTNNPVVVEEPQNNTTQTKQLTVYYADNQLLKISQEEHEVEFTNEKELLMNVWKKLQTPGSEENLALWEEVIMNDAWIKDHIVYLDLSLPDQLTFGSSAEGMAIQTLLQTFGQLEEVESVQILLNGEVSETLAGHVSIDQPISKHEVIYKGNE